MVFLVARDWYRWHRLHHPRLVVSRSMLALRIWENDGLGARAFRGSDFYAGQFMSRSSLGNNIPAQDTEAHGRKRFQVGYARYDNSCIE
jgi:hypothetical protein